MVVDTDSRFTYRESRKPRECRYTRKEKSEKAQFCCLLMVFNLNMSLNFCTSSFLIFTMRIVNLALPASDSLLMSKEDNGYESTFQFLRTK